jgi:Fe-S-cluster containining protein
MSKYCLECSKEGKDCCREAHAKFVTLKDARRIAKFLNEDINSFIVYGGLRKEDKEEYIYIHRHQNYYYDLTANDGKLLQLKDKSDGSCMFQEQDGCCRIYPARLLICRTYPFWYSDEKDVIFDGCSSDCPIVCAVTGNDDPDDVTKLADDEGSHLRLALEYIGHSATSIRGILDQMMDEIEDYRSNINTFVMSNKIEIV